MKVCGLLFVSEKFLNKGENMSSKKKKQKSNKGFLMWFFVMAVMIIGIAFMVIKVLFPSESDKKDSENEMKNVADEEEIVLSEEEILEQKIDEILSDMTLDEKICQLFIVTPEALTGYETVTAAGETTKSSLAEYPVGGLVYFAKNLIDAEQTSTMLKNTMDYGYEIEGLPLFLGVDEEGGIVARVANNSAFGVENVGPMGNITTESEAYEAGATIGGYLADLGFNLDFAPDADVLTNSSNTVIGNRSFGTDPEMVTNLAVAVSNGLHSQNIMSTFKHFPGHGATEGDTHEGFAYTDKTYEELSVAELVPFAAAEENGVDLIMAAHISVPQILGDNTPCTLSKVMITDVLRKDLGYNGLIITDALNMGAITGLYSSDEAAVKALEAGVDLLLMPEDFKLAVSGVKQAVEDGAITEERLDESVRRIVKAKLAFMEE